MPLIKYHDGTAWVPLARALYGPRGPRGVLGPSGTKHPSSFFQYTLAVTLTAHAVAQGTGTVDTPNPAFTVGPQGQLVAQQDGIALVTVSAHTTPPSRNSATFTLIHGADQAPDKSNVMASSYVMDQNGIDGYGQVSGIDTVRVNDPIVVRYHSPTYPLTAEFTFRAFMLNDVFVVDPVAPGKMRWLDTITPGLPAATAWTDV